jgi:hypothetical protein
MKKYSILLFVLAITIQTNAQFVGLTPTEIIKLKNLLKTDKVAAEGYSTFNNEAKSTLTDKPNPRDTIVSEGHLKGNPDKTASREAMKDYRKIYSLSLAYKVEGNTKYLSKAKEYLAAWATVNHPTGNPINDTKLDFLLMGYDMIRAELADTDKQKVDNWLLTIAEKELLKGKKGKARTCANSTHSVGTRSIFSDDHRRKIQCNHKVIDSLTYPPYPRPPTSVVPRTTDARPSELAPRR